MATNILDTELFDEEGDIMVLAAKNGEWDTVWDILDRKPYLVNCIPKEKAWAILHQAIWGKNEKAVKKILAVPDCNSELLTKNGLRPLDIETTPEIITLLEQHIALGNGLGEIPEVETFDSKEGQMLPEKSGDITEKKTSEIKENLTIENVKKQTFEEDNQYVADICKQAKSRNWKEVFSMLDKRKNLINKVDRVSGMSTIHYLAEANEVQLMQKCLQYPACNSGVKTLENSPHGTGKTAAEITTSPEVKLAIKWKEKELQEKRLKEPTFVSIHDSNLILMNYAWQAMEEFKGILCDDNLRLELLEVFPEMGWVIYDFINSGENWEKAKDVIAREMYKLDATKDLKNSTSRDSFFNELFTYYTDDLIYSELNLELRKQAMNKPIVNTKFKAYSAVLNALLFQNFLKLSVYTGKTIRSMKLGEENISKYKVGKEFSWLTFTDFCGLNKLGGNCVFEIDNSQSCVWSPRKISLTYPGEEEYLYPCGAQFRVMEVKKEYRSTTVYLKLICPKEPRPLLPLVTSNFALKADRIKEAIVRLMKKREESEESKKKLLKMCMKVEKYTNFERQIIERTEKKEIRISDEAYNCTICNYTCHYPCPDADLENRKCVVSIADGHCQNCPLKCHFAFHKKENFIFELESKIETMEDEKKKAKFEKAKEMEKAEETILETIQHEVDTLTENVRTQFDAWDVMTQQFENMLGQEQVIRGDSKKMLKLYTKNKQNVQTARSQLKGHQLI